jgi:hypothetical protein
MADIVPNLNNLYFNNPLKRLMEIQSDFTFRGRDLRLVKTLLLFTFSRMDDVPSVDRVKNELITNPSIDHTWFKVIEMFQHFSD